MKVANCLIIKNENRYLREWVEYYKSIGYDSILLYDNNDVDGECPHEVIGDHISSGYVVYHDVRGSIRPQKRVYNECLNGYKFNYDWISFFDTDEFLNVSDIKEYLSLPIFKNFDEILINWTMVNDGDVLDDDNALLNRNVRLIHPVYPGTGAPMDWTVKTILRTKTKAEFITSIHHASGNIRTCNSYGRPVFSCLYEKNPQTLVSLIHFRTKTISEYLKRISSGDVNLQHGTTLMYNKLESFFSSNTLTEDKLKVVKKYFPEWTPFSITDEGIDVVVLESRGNHEMEVNIKKYLPFVKKVWFVDNFERIYDLNIAERFIVISKDVVFKHTCLDRDFFIENQVARCEWNYIVPMFRIYCRGSLEESILMHDNMGCRRTMTFYIDNSKISCTKAFVCQ